MACWVRYTSSVAILMQVRNFPILQETQRRYPQKTYELEGGTSVICFLLNLQHRGRGKLTEGLIKEFVSDRKERPWLESISWL